MAAFHYFAQMPTLLRFARSANRLALPEMPIDLFIKTVEELVKTDAGWVPGKIGEALYITPIYDRN